MERYEQILEYWFGGVADHLESMSENRPEYMKARLELWFGGTPEIDWHIRQNYEADLMKAEKGVLEAWKVSPRGALAFVILCDQFSRNIYRDQPRGISFDTLALKTCLDSIEKGFDQQVSLIERSFFYMPMMHSEDLEVEKEGVQRFAHLRNAAPNEWKSLFANFHHYAEMHLDMIDRFGRFPDRNEMLGRKSTPEEIEALKDYPF